MKRKWAILLAAALAMTAPLAAFADEKDDRIAELESEVEDLKAQVVDLQKQLDEALAKTPAATDQESYKIGDTWVVDGQWKLTVTSVEETAERNEYADTDPAAVYLVTYEYENLGYEADGWNGLFLSLEDGIVDAEGSMGYSYPGDVTKYAQETPVGAKCTAQSCIGVEHAGDFQIHFSMYDGNGKEQKAVFDIAL